MTPEDEIERILLKIQILKSFFKDFEELYIKAENEQVHIFYGSLERAKEKLDEQLNFYRIRLGKLRGKYD